MSADSSPTSSDAAAEGSVRVRTAVWFGNAGSPYGDFGIGTLRMAEAGLREAAKVVPLRLLVISNNEGKFKAVTRKFPFPCDYLPWSRELVLAELAKADVCLVPNSRDRFSLGKSANRILLALNAGAPVVASWAPAAEPLRPFVVFDDWVEGIHETLLDPEAAKAKVKAAQAFIAEHYAPKVMAGLWLDHLAERRVVPRGDISGRTVLLFADAIEDLELVAALRADLASFGLTLVVGVTTAFASRSANVALSIGQGGAPLHLFPPEGAAKAAALRHFGALLFLEDGQFESKAAHRLARQAARTGKTTLSLQRSLMQSDPASPPWRPAAERLLVWRAPDPSRLRPLQHPLANCAVARRPALAQAKPVRATFPPGERLIAVFENLHYARYSEPMRIDFVNVLLAAARARTNDSFIVRSHPTGRWLLRQAAVQVEWPANILVMDPNLPRWAAIRAIDLIAAADRIITTPSTIALDAAELGRPAAVVRPDGADFAPLPRLQSLADWLAWIDHGEASPGAPEAFCARRLTPEAPSVGQFIAEALHLTRAAVS